MPYAPLIPVDLTCLGGVVAYTGEDGKRRMCSWSGPTKRVWAELKPGSLPPLVYIRDVMVAAYEPNPDPAALPPQGLMDCICFYRDPEEAEPCPD